jgi:hypothetical protein
LKKTLVRIVKLPELAIGLLLLFFVYQFVWSKDHWQTGVLSTDGRGYYSYLPAFIIYQDLTFQKSNAAVEEQFGNEMSHHCILKDKNGRTFNKTFPGVALMQTPLFLLSLVVARLFGFSINGFSEPFLIGVQLSAVFAAIFGFFAVRKTLELMGLSVKKSVFIAFLAILATNVFYYATAVPSLGHIYSFALMSFIVYTTKKMGVTLNSKYLYQIVFLLALLLLIRPTNGIVVLLIPFILGSKEVILNLYNQLKKRWSILVKSVVIGLTVLSVLPLLWLVQTGKPFVWSYTGEGFYWWHPVPLKVLFSFRNGLFIWTPIAFIALFGLYFAYKKLHNSWLLVFAIAYFILNLYIISAWWTYYYGGGFGHRVYVEHQVFTALLLGYLFLYLSPNLKKVFIGLSLVLGSLNIAQAIQMNKGILPQDYVNWEMYQLLFLKFDDKWIGECNATLDCQQYGEVHHIDYLKPLQIPDSGEFEFDASREFGGDVVFEIPSLSPTTNLFLEYNFEKMRISESPFNDVYMVVDGTNEQGETVFYEAHELYHIRSEAFNKWKLLLMSLQLPKDNIKSYKIYIWNQGKHHFKVKNIDVRILQIQP